METLFNKNDYKTFNGKTKLIIDCDPGVDDTACLTYALFDENIEVSDIFVGGKKINKE